MSKKNTFESTEITETENPNEGNTPGTIAQEEQAGTATVQGEQSGAVSAANSAEPVVYCGPNIPKGNLPSMAVFRGGLPGNVRRLAEKIPEIDKLIVPVSRLSDVRKKIAERGSEENRLNQVILAAREGI